MMIGWPILDCHGSRPSRKAGSGFGNDNFSTVKPPIKTFLESAAMKPRTDVFYLNAARAARGFGDGFAVIILPAYLSEIGFSPFQIGLVAAAALLGSAGMTMAVGILARHHDLRRLLLISTL